MIDPLTKEEFIIRRRNQKYKSAINRINHNNEKAALLRNEKAPIDKLLLRNYILLKSLLLEGEEKVFKKDYLVGLGYDVHVFTHFDVYKNQTCRYLYKFALLKTAEPNALIIAYPKKHD